MRLLVVADDFPLPANSGGRNDTWRRLQALKAAGTELALLSWYDAGRQGPPTAPQLEQAHTVLETLQLYPITRSPAELARRAVHLGRLPSHAAARWVTVEQADLLAWARSFRPEAVLLDRLFGAASVRWLAAQLGLPWAYRSHNREAQYMRGQLERAHGWRSRLGLRVNQWGLAALEQQVLRSAGAVLDISQDDTAHWQARGVALARWLPPAVDPAFVSAVAQAAEQARPRWDLLYFGNLNTPNNLEALAWWVDEVLPLLPDASLRIAIAGSRPSPSALACAARDARIELLADPVDMAPLIASARVLVNPMLSGSGVNLKSVEMLYTRARLLSTPVGVQGLPEEVKACFEVAGGADAFALITRAALAAPAISADELAARAAARECFAPQRHAAGVLASFQTAGIRR